MPGLGYGFGIHDAGEFCQRSGIEQYVVRDALANTETQLSHLRGADKNVWLNVWSEVRVCSGAASSFDVRLDSAIHVSRPPSSKARVIAMSEVVEREVSACCQDAPGIAGQHHA